MASAARCLLITTNVTLWTVGALLLAAGLLALLKPHLEISQAVLDDDSGRPPAEVAGFYVVSGSLLLLTAMLGCGGSCGERYAWLVVYMSVLSLVTGALIVYLALQLNTCIKEKVCTKSFDVQSRRHWSILVQSLAVFVLLVTLSLATLVCCKARARRGYLAVPL
uniref:Putative conserved plasma membrane protein n=1 Tax=Amblyomma triste TaxID=251400 RepID=A0A023GCF9_AMBTT